MTYADAYPWIRHGFVRLQGAARVIERLPDGVHKAETLRHIDAAEASLRALDDELEAIALAESEAAQ